MDVELQNISYKKWHLDKILKNKWKMGVWKLYKYSKQKERQEKNHVGEESKGARYVGLTDDYARECITELK